MELSVGILNTNGLRPCNYHEIETILIQEDLDILALTETHRREYEFTKGPQITGYSWIEYNRSGSEKQGGGLGALIKSNMPINVWDGIRKNTERMWILVQDSYEKHAYVNIYLSCQSKRRGDRSEENIEILSLIQQEIAILKVKDFKIIVMGDLNSRLGCEGKHSIPGNSPDVNSNGELLKTFLDTNDLVVGNSLALATGLFTRISTDRRNVKSILDLFCIEESLVDSLVALVVDEDNQYEISSDHRHGIS